MSNAILVEEDVHHVPHDADEVEQHPDHWVAELGGLHAEHRQVALQPSERGLELRLQTLLARTFPRVRAGGVEHLKPANVVVATSAHELVRDVEAVEAA